MNKQSKNTCEQSNPEKLKVIKNVGVTDTERYLAKLAERSFLNLWSYPNPYRDKKLSGGGDGKEICDLLVVCDHHVIIFSEKSIGWPEGNIDLAWCRWAKRAIKSAAAQAKGAERWISQFPNRVFLDQACSQPFPISLPSSKNWNLHKVIVARGASNACRRQFPEGIGSLTIKPSIIGNSHWQSDAGKVEPFAIGDIDPSDSFVHVVDEISLDVIMKELDTIRDFTDYLEKRSKLIRSGKLLVAHGEENLLAYYSIRVNEDGDHDFVFNNERENLRIDRSHFASYVNDPQYIAKKEEDKISYVWDRLIEQFTNHMISGTVKILSGHSYSLRDSELGVRYMALESRFSRRLHGKAIIEALEKGEKIDRFLRIMIKPEWADENETAFFICTLKYLDRMKEYGDYDYYRQKRTEFVTVCARGILERHHYLKRIIGVICEPPNQGGGTSEDLIYMEQSNWSEKDRQSIREDCKTYGVLQNMKSRVPNEREFPEVDTITFEIEPATGMNRKQRRAAKARDRRQHR